LPIRLLPDTRSDIQAEHILVSMLDNIKPDAKQEPRRIWIDRRVTVSVTAATRRAAT
jgi:hypothetical protein